VLEEFEQLGLSSESLIALEKKGFEKPSDIQRECIPLLLKEKTDVIGQAQTGTGKTAAFGLPILEMLSSESHFVQALVLTPTRELAIQVCEEISSLRGNRKSVILPIYGGASMSDQLRALRHKVDVVVGTPGRIMDHLERGTLDLSNIKVAVLDEADEMLDMGFIEDIEHILEQTNNDKRMLCFSATMPQPILKLATRFMPHYKLVRIENESPTTDLTTQIYYETRQADKLEVLYRVIEINKDFYGLVFCRTKASCDQIGARLIDKGYNAEILHGDLSQKMRELILHKMKEHVITILVATDVAARGIDIQDLTHVINYDLPGDPESYIHRIGRTGRAGKMGKAITFVTRSDTRKFAFIQKVTKSDIQKQKIPTVQEIQKAKKEKIEEELIAYVNDEKELKEKNKKVYQELTLKLLESGKPHEEIISTILAYHYKKELDVTKLKNIREMEGTLMPQRGRTNSSRRRDNSNDSTGFSDFDDVYDDDERKGRNSRESAGFAGLDNEGFARLFIARGEKDGLNEKALVAYLYDNAGTRKEEIRDIEVHDNFSFISTSYPVAEHLINVFESHANGGRPIIQKANASPNSHSRSRKPRDYQKRSSKRPSSSRRDEDDFVAYSENSRYPKNVKRNHKRR